MVNKPGKSNLGKLRKLEKHQCRPTSWTWHPTPKNQRLSARR